MGKKVANKFGKSVHPKSHKPKLNKEKEYQAEDILDVAYVENVAFFKVKWLNYPNSQCTWEPIDNVKNFKNKIKKILKNNPVIINYKSLNELYTHKPKKQQIILKTEEYVKKKRATGRGRKSKQIRQNSQSQEGRKDKKNNETQVQIKINDPADTETEKIVRVVDLQQVFHQQTNKVHVVVKTLVQLTNNRTKRSKEVQKWTHIEDIRHNMDTLTLLADFLLENVQFEKTVEYANDKDPDNQVFKGVNFLR